MDGAAGALGGAEPEQPCAAAEVEHVLVAAPGDRFEDLVAHPLLADDDVAGPEPGRDRGGQADREGEAAQRRPAGRKQGSAGGHERERGTAEP